MESEFLDIRDLSQYLKLPKSNIYSKVEDGTLPHYRIGRLIRFKKADIDLWMEAQRRVSQNIPFTKLFKPNANRSSVDKIVRKAIDEVKGLQYNPARETRPIKGLNQKGGNNGAL